MNKKKIIALLIGILIVLTPLTIFLIIYLSDSNPVFRVVEGDITEDQEWKGFIHVSGTVQVSNNATLTILPGTYVEFKHYRGYKDPKVIGLSTNGGHIKAIGEPDKQIWFTSDAEVPINGDWGGIYCRNTNQSIFKYIIVEFASIGIEMENSKVKVSHSIIRWINLEGVYASSSQGVIEYNLIYDNGYHDLALENFNPNITVKYNIFNGGHEGIYAEATNVTIEGNYFVNYTGVAIAGSQFSNLTILSNRFESIQTAAISLTPPVNNVTSGNDFSGAGTVPIPELGFGNPEPRPLGYIPGDPEDQYLYVFSPEDETRRVIDRLEDQTSFGWTLAYVNESLWRFAGTYEIGQRQDFIRINLTTLQEEKFGNDILLNPGGLSYDGNYFWTYDIVLNKFYKFKINISNYIEIIDSFPLPSEVPTLIGFTTDGTNLYVASGGTALYKLDMSGNYLETITLSGGFILGVMVWTGEYFWANSELYLTKWHKNGTLAGKIYPVALGTIGITWDSNYLWTVQKTCETWLDKKIFQIEVIDDQFLDV